MDIIQFSDIKKCALCGKPTQNKHTATGEYVHQKCANGYDQDWDEREAELEYRRSERTFMREQRRYIGCIYRYRLAFRLCFFRVMDVPPFELVAPGTKLKKTLSRVRDATFTSARYSWEKIS
jgi:hypothetical protein